MLKQMFADMVRVSSQLVYDAMTRANIIDEVVIYGLLTNYKTGTAIVMKYNIDFVKAQSSFFAGEEVDAVRDCTGNKRYVWMIYD